MTDLSIILITKNQEWNIARLIQSALAGTSRVSSRELVLVDSASTDRTIDIASSYPISIIRLLSDQRLTSHAGRYVGYKYTSGDLVLFLDGDMELCKGWLEKALTIIESRPNVAIVAGPWIDLPIETHHSDEVKYKQCSLKEPDTEVTWVGGAAMYRRSVMEQVGTFNPWLYSDGEPELCVRVRHAGYKIIRVGHPIAYHYSDPSEAISTAVRRRRRNLYLGMGQSLRYHFGTELFWPYLRERGYGCIPTMVLLAVIISLITSVATGNWMWFGGWMLLSGLVLVTYWLRKRSLYAVIRGLIHRLFIIEGTIRGFLLEPLDSFSCTPRFEVVRNLDEIQYRIEQSHKDV
jgi:glycosyltransferase involved in cell wall biosynthesis